MISKKFILSFLLEIKSSPYFWLSKIYFGEPSSNVIDLIGSGELDLSGLITERFPLEEVNKGLNHLYRKIENPIRFVIELG